MYTFVIEESNKVEWMSSQHTVTAWKINYTVCMHTQLLYNCTIYDCNHM